METDLQDELLLRKTWTITTYCILSIVITSNIILLLILIYNKKLSDSFWAIIFSIATADLGYGCLVIPFFVDNYIQNNWISSFEYCRFFTFYFTFHDIFLGFGLISICIHISIKFTGLYVGRKLKNIIKIGFVPSVVCMSILASLPTTFNANIFMETSDNSKFRQECRALDIYSMIIVYGITSSILFCFTMGFLLSLCVLGSPLLKIQNDIQEHNYRWQRLVTISLVNILFITCGFPLNFKEFSRFLYKYCFFRSPFSGKIETSQKTLTIGKTNVGKYKRRKVQRSKSRKVVNFATISS